MTNKKLQTSSTLICEHCSKEFKYESEKKRHVSSHFPLFKCKVCLKKFSFISSLRRHEKQHSRTGDVKCDLCNRSFRDETLLKRHINYAHRGCAVCPKCNLSYNSESALAIHMKTHIPEAQRKYKCTYVDCNKTFNFHHHWRHHILTHTNKKQYFCDKCNKGFIQLHHLKTHIRTHNPEKLIPCGINGCTKTFTDNYAKKRHETTCKKRHEAPLSIPSLKSSVTVESNDSQFIGDNRKININAEMSDNILEEELNIVTDIEANHILDLTIPCKAGPPRVNTSEDLNLIESNESNEITTCKTVLGECLSKNSGNNCVCEQMVSVIEEPYNLSTVISKPSTETNAFDITNCEGCECAASCNAKYTNRKDACFKRMMNAMPSIEYVNGTVKIKDTFDYDIIISRNSNQRSDDFKGSEEITAFKSCEAALGKCIVSGNGEECLCAKMMSDEHVTAEEIDDITPQPNKTDFD